MASCVCVPSPLGDGSRYAARPRRVAAPIATTIARIRLLVELAWTESAGRRDWWDKHPPNRKYVCGDRATAWLGTIPHDLRNVPKNKGGAGVAGPTAFGWYIWERGHPPGTLEGRVYRE